MRLLQTLWAVTEFCRFCKASARLTLDGLGAFVWQSRPTTKVSVRRAYPDFYYGNLTVLWGSANPAGWKFQLTPSAAATA